MPTPITHLCFALLLDLTIIMKTVIKLVYEM